MVTRLILTLTLVVGIPVESVITGSTDISISTRSTVQRAVCNGERNGKVICNKKKQYYSNVNITHTTRHNFVQTVVVLTQACVGTEEASTSIR